MASPIEQVRGAAQRTDLAWARSGLAVGFVVVVVLRRVAMSAQASDTVTVVLLGAGLATWSAAFWVVRRVARRKEGPQPALKRVTPGLVTTGTVLMAAAAFVLVLLPGP
jgi:uncharacterized membrane protein YidH (DUF202 family)